MNNPVDQKPWQDVIMYITVKEKLVGWHHAKPCRAKVPMEGIRQSPLATKG